MELTNIRVEGMILGVDLDDGMLYVYTDGEFRGGVRVAEPLPAELPPPPEVPTRGLPAGWHVTDGQLYDDKGILVDVSS